MCEIQRQSQILYCKIQELLWPLSDEKWFAVMSHNKASSTMRSMPKNGIEFKPEYTPEVVEISDMMAEYFQLTLKEKKATIQP